MVTLSKSSKLTLILSLSFLMGMTSFFLHVQCRVFNECSWALSGSAADFFFSLFLFLTYFSCEIAFNQNKLYDSVFILISFIGIELSQLIVLPGTFDPYDIAAYFLSFGVYHFLRRLIWS